jgi:type 1 glutamine amidotransferase
LSDLVYVSDVAPYRPAGGGLQLAGVHQSLASAARACREIASVHGLGCRGAESVDELAPAVLEQARVLVLFTIGETAWTPEQRNVIESRVAAGTMGLLGLHAATDSAYGWARFGDLLGARFAGHPVTAELPISVVDPAHPATAHLSSPWNFVEELYLFDDLVADARVLLAVDPADLSSEYRDRVASHLGTGLPLADGALLPIAWCIERGPMRSFYTVLGHFVAAYEDQRYLEHLSGAVRWILGGTSSTGTPSTGTSSTGPSAP